MKSVTKNFLFHLLIGIIAGLLSIYLYSVIR